MAEFIQDLVKPTIKGQITIPVEIRRDLGITPRSILNVALRGRTIVINPVKIKREKEILLRNYTRQDLERFVKADKLDPKTVKKLDRILSS